jgi:dephospho-CoA kinase
LIVIALTGGIASGKSTAARLLGGHGAVVIDADRLGHQAYEPGTAAHGAVIARFGEAVRGADGRIDRKALGGRVFGDPAALEQLTSIVWPEIRRLAEAEIATARHSGARVAVLEAAVLFEAGWEDLGDEIWVVVVDRETAIARTVARDGVDRAAVERRLDAQLSNEQRAARANVVIDNCGSPEQLERLVDAQWQRLLRTRAAS